MPLPVTSTFRSSVSSSRPAGSCSLHTTLMLRQLSSTTALPIPPDVVHRSLAKSTADRAPELAVGFLCGTCIASGFSPEKENESERKRVRHSKHYMHCSIRRLSAFGALSGQRCEPRGFSGRLLSSATTVLAPQKPFVCLVPFRIVYRSVKRDHWQSHHNPIK